MKKVWKLWVTLVLLGTFISCTTDDSTTRLDEETFERSLESAITLMNLDGASLSGASLALEHHYDDNDGSLTGGILRINDLTNNCDSLPCTALAAADLGMLTIGTNNNFTLKDDVEKLDVPVPDQLGAASVKGVPAGSFTIVRVSDSVELVYNIEANYNGLPVTMLATLATSGAGGIGSLVAARFGNTELEIDFSDGVTLALSGINAVSGLGEINNGTELPDGYEVTAEDGTAYTFTDPDGAAVNADNPEVLAELMIAEWNNGAVVPDNAETYAVTLTLTESTEFGGGHITAATGVLVNVGANTIELTVNNGCVAAPPCANAGAALGTATITETASIFTIEGITDAGGVSQDSGTGEVTINIPDQAGAASMNAVTLGTISISNNGVPTTTYTISVSYNGVPVEELIAAIVTNAPTDITNAITSTFNGFTLDASLNGNSSTLALSGVTNTDKTTSGGTPSADELRKTTTGTIYLPSGYEVTTASGTDYDFTDPDGSGIAAYPATALTEGQLIIAERDGSGDIVSGNSETYTVTLELEALQQLEAADLSTALSGVTLTVAYNPTPLITVNGLTNACSTLPCDIAEVNFRGLVYSNGRHCCIYPCWQCG